jgi:integrase
MPRKPPKHAKPWPNFPLTVHPNGQYSKKIRGRVHYFDPDAAVELYNKQKDHLYAGLAPPVEGESVADLLNLFIEQKEQAVEIGELSQVSLNEYVCTTDIMAATLGKNRSLKGIIPNDLLRLRKALQQGKTKTLGVAAFKRRLTLARIVCKFSNDEFGTNIRYQKPLAAPPRKLLRQRRAEIGERLFTAKQLRDLIAKADPHMKAVIYLGINAAYGPADCIGLTTDRIVDGFATYVRSKTGVQRRCPLWPETQTAVAAIADGEHVFNGRVWNRHIIAHQFKTLCEAVGIYKAGVTTPYTCRRTFETVAKNAEVNQSVIDRIVGHERPDMSEVYNQRVFDKQLLRCTDFVKRWLDGKVVPQEGVLPLGRLFQRHPDQGNRLWTQRLSA